VTEEKICAGEGEAKGGVGGGDGDLEKGYEYSLLLDAREAKPLHAILGPNVSSSTYPEHNITCLRA